ncbi:MAG TPA: dihydropteroate synthase [Pirellulales bacterium]|nr:dihydropteroate synthase [Pirellulales bacterium]
MPLEVRFPARATSWLLRTRRLELPRRPLVMGVVNVTPDSFSDGGRFDSPAAAVEQGLRLIEQGADLLDVGGESTRPYAEAVAAEEELRRVIPVVAELSRRAAVPISIDTSKARVAREAVNAGAEIINDITALAGDPAMPEVARETRAGVCAMHMQGTPQTMQDNPSYADVVAEVLAYLRERRRWLVAAGIDPERLALDPGIGFGKTHQHNLTLLSHCDRFHELGSPLVVGPSRKGFIAKILQDKQADRTAGTIGVALSLASQGVQILRVHDVEPVSQALLLYEATGGIER